MKVDFNNLRKQALNAYEALVEKLNGCIIKNDDNYARPNNFAYETNLKGFVLVDAEEIRKEMDSLRMLIGSIALVHEPGDDDFKDVFEEVFPGREKMTCFNEEEQCI